MFRLGYWTGFMLRIGLRYPDIFCNILLLCHPVYFHDARGMCPWHILNYLSPPFALCDFVCIPLCSWCIRVHDGALISSWLGIFSLSLYTLIIYILYINSANAPQITSMCGHQKFICQWFVPQKWRNGGKRSGAMKTGE